MKLPKDLQEKYNNNKKRTYHTNQKRPYKNNIREKGNIEQFGPISIQQQGNLTMMRNILGLNKQKEFLKDSVSKRPVIKENIRMKIRELKEIVEEYNPIHLLHYICIKHSFFNPETYKESENMSQEIWVEYALSFTTSVKSTSPTVDPDKKILDRFENLIKEIIELCRHYYMTEGAIEPIGDPLKSIRFEFILRYLSCRGDSYENHHKELVLQTFQPHDDFFSENYGFTTEEIIVFSNDLRNQIKENLESFKKQQYEFLLKFQEMARRHKLKKRDKCEDITAEDLEKFNKNEEMRTLREDFLKYLNKREKFNFKIHPREDLPEALLELFSIKFEENIPFQEGEAFWPLNDSMIYSKPVIKYNQEFYGFGSSIFFRNMITILEELIQKANQKYYSNNFLKKKGKVLEELSLKFFKNIIPTADIYGELYYNIIINGERRRFETDGLIIYDENLFIIEAKAHKLTLSARRGSVLRIKKTAKNIIDDAYKQGIRCKNYILENPIAKFYDKKGREVISVKADNFRSIFLINTTFEDLSHLSTQLHELKAFNLVEGKEWPWTVFINDLRIISEIVENPSTFILYLQRRIKMNDLEFLMTTDELDFFMFFLKKGLYFEDINIPSKSKLSLFGFTDELDRYYFFEHGYISKVEKPIFNIPNTYKKIVKDLESSRKKGFTLAAISLLGLDSRDHKQFLKLLPKYKKESFHTSKDYKMFFYFKKQKLGLLFVIRTNNTNTNWSNHRDFLELMIYKHKLIQGIIFKCIFTRKSDIIPQINFEIIEKEWKFNLEMDRRVKKSKFKGMRKIKGRRTGSH